MRPNPTPAHRPSSTPLAFALLASSMLTLIGCSQPSRGGLKVSGTVNLNGQPMPEGSIVFIPHTLGHKAAGKITDGSFLVPASAGPLPGHYRVEVYAAPDANVPLDDPLAFANGPPLPPANTIAPQFNTRSTLKVEVKQGQANQFLFNVDSVSQ